MLRLSRIIDLISRIYWYSCGRYDVFDLAVLPAPYLNKDQEKYALKFERIDVAMIAACLPASKIYRVCREILQKLIIRDSSIRLNGRALQKIETHFSDKFIYEILITLPEQDLGLSPIFLSNDFDTIIHQVADCLFNHSGIEQLNRTGRFTNPHGNINQLIRVCKQVDLFGYLHEIIPAVLVASYPLLEQITKKKYNHEK